jgi:hypothetical protein
VGGNRVNAAADWSMGGISADRGTSGTGQYNNLTDYFLVDLAEGAVHFPQGIDRGLLTAAVQHALQNNHNDVKLSDFASYVARESLIQLTGVSDTRTGSVATADAASKQRHFTARGQPDSIIQTWWKMMGHTHEETYSQAGSVEADM